MTDPRCIYIVLLLNILVSYAHPYCFHNNHRSDEKKCSEINVPCLNCTFAKTCEYGNKTNRSCTVLDHIQCSGKRTFTVEFDCSYCYLLPKSKYTCGPRSNCSSTASPQERVIVNCTVHSNVHCFGKRTFRKSFACNWTSGTRWSTAFLLSITLGGFGADRFYLGQWEEGLGKFFSFGGLGVWTLVDIVLVGIGYITPADGSLYIF